MWFRYLTASAACATLLALAASGFVRTHFPEVIASLAARTSEGAPADAPLQAEGSFPLVFDLAPEGAIADAPRPNSLLLPNAARGRRGATSRPSSYQNSERDTFAHEVEQGIRKVAERCFEIKRRSLDLALGNLGLLAKAVRVAPDVRDGKPVGFRVFAIAANGPIALLGLRDDDVLISINGLDITTPDRVLDAYGKLKTAPHLVLGLIRENHEVTQDYTIR
jgi:hypothetical protein